MYTKYAKVRDSRGYKDADVSRETGINRSTFSDWKSGRSKPKTDKLQKIANFLEVPLAYLTDEDWQPTITDKDEKDIKKAIDAIKNQLATGTGLTYDGKSLSDDAVSRLVGSMEYIISEDGCDNLIELSIEEHNNKKFHDMLARIGTYYQQLNASGKEKVFEYVKDLVASERYVDSDEEWISPDVGLSYEDWRSDCSKEERRTRYEKTKKGIFEG